MKTITIQQVINEIKNSESGIMSIVLTDSSRYAKNSNGSLTYAGTLFTKKCVNSQPGDEVIMTGNKQTNLSEVERVLTSLMGKGEVQVRLMNGTWLTGEVVEEPEFDAAPREFSVVAGEKNSVFVWSSAYNKSFFNMPEVTDDMIVVITNAHTPTVVIFDASGMTEEEKVTVVKRHCSNITRGCNYRYEIVKKIGNTYFCN